MNKTIEVFVNGLRHVCKNVDEIKTIEIYIKDNKQFQHQLYGPMYKYSRRNSNESTLLTKSPFSMEWRETVKRNHS